MLFFRVIQHLLPTARAWLLVVDRVLRKFFEGLALGVPVAARAVLDSVAEQLRPETTTQLPLWQDQFGLVASGDEDQQRLQLAAAWRARGGQSPQYLQDLLQAAGFDLYVHEWWEPETNPRVVRDPRDYVDQPLLGSVQCGDEDALCGDFDALCDAFLQNDPHYLVNQNLTPAAPPPIPGDPRRWRHFIYVGGETFPQEAVVPAERRAELERMLLQYRPTHAWVVLLTTTGAFEISGFAIDDESGPDTTTEFTETIESVVSMGGESLRGIAFHNSVGVAVGQSGQIRRSTDTGDTWSALHAGDHPDIGALDIQGVASDGDGGMALIANQSLTATKILFSTDDGATWAPSTDALAAGISGVTDVSDVIPSNTVHGYHSSMAFGGGRYVALAQQTGTGALVSLVSSDGGETWSAFEAFADSGDGFFNHLRYLNGAFYFIASDPIAVDLAVFRSVNGETWVKTLLSAPAGGFRPDIAYVSGTLVITSDASGLAVARSADNGSTWSAFETDFGSAPSGTRLEVVDGRLHLFGASLVIVSDDAGVTWEEIFDALSNQPKASTVHSGRIFTTDVDSSDARILAYDSVDVPVRITGARTKMDFNGAGIGLAVGVETGTDEGFIARSTVAREWVGTRLSTLIPGLTDPLFGVAVHGSNAVAVGVDVDEGNSLLALFSADAGVTWSRTATDLTALGMSAGLGLSRGVLVAYGGGLFVAVGIASTGVFNAAYSADNGETWSPNADPLGGAINLYLTRLRYLNGAFYALLISETFSETTMLRSVDGVTWTQHSLPLESLGGALDFALVGDTFVALGFDNFATTQDCVRWTSPDGMTWTRSSASGFEANLIPIALTDRDGTLFAATAALAPASGGVFTSTDLGATWDVIPDDIGLNNLAGVVDLMFVGDRLTGSRSTWFFSSI